MRLLSMLAGTCLVHLAICSANAADLPPDFYAGGAEMNIQDHEAYKAFLERNKAKIQQIGLTIAIIRANPQSKGCVGFPIFTCIASIAQTIPVGSNFTPTPRYHAQNAPLDDPDLDINGKPLPSAPISLTLLIGKMGVDPRRMAFLHQATDGTVDQVSISLVESPLMARTFDEYESTQVYEAAVALMPGTCDLKDRRKFYQFIENVMKPTEDGSHSVDASALAITDHSSIKATGHLCGLDLEVRNGASVSTEDVTLENPHGVSVSYWFSVAAPDGGYQPAVISPPGRMRLGIKYLNLPPEIAKAMRQPNLSGAWIVSIVPGSVAEKAGFRIGDVITVYDSSAIHSVADLQAALAKAAVKPEVVVTVARPEGTIELQPKF